MEDGYKTKPTLIQLEALRYRLLEEIYKSDSAILKISCHLEYIHHILQFKNPNIEESFLVEILDDYLRTIKKYEVWGNEPKITRKIVEQLKTLCELGAASKYREELTYNLQRIEKQRTLEQLFQVARISGASFATSVTDVGHNANLIYKKDQPRSIGVTAFDLLSD